MVEASEIPKAEKFARDQRLCFAPLMKVDATKVIAPADIALCTKVAELAESDPMKWDAMLSKPAVNALFVCGALYFEKVSP